MSVHWVLVSPEDANGVGRIPHMNSLIGYPLAMTNIAIENGHRNSEFSHWKCWFSHQFFVNVYQSVIQPLYYCIPWLNPWIYIMGWTMEEKWLSIHNTGWWFGTFFMFPYIGNSNPNWLIFFRGVETTNQNSYWWLKNNGMKQIMCNVGPPR